MRKSRAVSFTALVAAAALVMAACSGTPGQQTLVRRRPPPAETLWQRRGVIRWPPAAVGMQHPFPVPENVGKVGGSGCGIPHGPYEEPAEKGGDVRFDVERSAPFLQQQHDALQRGRRTRNIAYLTNHWFHLLRRELEPDQQ